MTNQDQHPNVEPDRPTPTGDTGPTTVEPAPATTTPLPAAAPAAASEAPAPSPAPESSPASAEAGSGSSPAAPVEATPGLDPVPTPTGRRPRRFGWIAITATLVGVLVVGGAGGFVLGRYTAPDSSSGSGFSEGDRPSRDGGGQMQGGPGGWSGSEGGSGSQGDSDGSGSGPGGDSGSSDDGTSGTTDGAASTNA